VRTPVRTISGFLMFFFAGFPTYLDSEDWPVQVGLAFAASILNPHVSAVGYCTEGLLYAAACTTGFVYDLGLAYLGAISGVKNVFRNDVAYFELEGSQPWVGPHLLSPFKHPTSMSLA
jgi:hypothetical protein